MTEPTFTKGPWEAVQKDDPRGQPVPYYRGLVCTVEHAPERYLSVVASDDRTVSREEWPANAALIAAAPDLYEVLERLLGTLNASGAEAEQYFAASDLAAADAALAKARGE